MPKTRSKGAPAPASKASNSNSSATSKYTLPSESTQPPRLFILPKNASSRAKVVLLPNPRYSRLTRYLVCPETGVYEFTRVAAPKTDPRSWLIGDGKSPSKTSTGSDSTYQSHVAQQSDLFVASAIDPLFLVLPALAKQSAGKSDPPKRMFLTSDDHLDALLQDDSHLAEVLRWDKIRKLFEKRMEAVCDTVAAGDDSMYRLSEKKLLREILAKAQRMGSHPLPPSMEEKFVRKALEAPVVSQRSAALNTQEVEQIAETATSVAADAVLTGTVPPSEEVSVAVDAGEQLLSEKLEDTTNGDVTTAMQASPEVVRLQRLRVAFNFICSSYLPPALTAALKQHLADQEEVDGQDIDFSPLDEYLTELAKARQTAATARSASDFSRKRARDEEDEERAEKKRKKEEEDKRKKANESRGVKQLKKIDVSGMKKMSDFFKKK